MDTPTSRRHFLVSSATGLTSLWVTTHWPGILSAQAHAKHATGSEPTRFEFFSPEQATEGEVICAQIIPTDDTPGAREARVIYFIDRALTTFDSDKQDAYREGMLAVQRTRASIFPDSAS